MESAGMAEMPANQGVRGRKGVQQGDVDRAADAIFAKGIRPTVERVRHFLGTGSPNTVAPMLETWFKNLSARVVGMTHGGPGDGLPPAAQNAFRLMWDTALAEARAMADNAIAQERADLEAAKNKLAEDTRVLQTSRAALEENVRLTQGQAETLRSQLSEVGTALRAKEAELLAEKGQTERVVDELAHVRQQRETQAAAYELERQRAVDRADVNERRLQTEVDRAREEAKALNKAVAASAEANKTLIAKMDALRDKNEELARQLTEHHENIVRSEAAVEQARRTEAGLRELLAGAQARIGDLGQTLAAEREATATLRLQLTAALKAEGPRPRASKRVRKTRKA